MIQVSLFVPDLLDSWGDLPDFLDRVKDAGCHRIHYLALRASPGGCEAGRCTMPYKVSGTYRRASGKVFLKYKLTNNWNPTFFDQQAYALTEMRKRGIVAEVSVEDIRLRSGDDKYYNPFYCSDEALSDSTPGGVWGEPGKKGMMPWHGYWMRRETKAVLQRQPRAIFEANNEMNTPSFSHHPGDDFDLYMVNDCRPKLAAGIVGAGVTANRTWTSGDLRNWRGGGAFYSAHGIVRPEKVRPLDGVPNTRLIISMDGGFDGDGDADIAGRKGASVEQTIAITRRGIEMRARKIEVMARKMWKRNKHVADLDDFDPATLRAAVKTAEKYGK